MRKSVDQASYIVAYFGVFFTYRDSHAKVTKRANVLLQNWCCEKNCWTGSRKMKSGHCLWKKRNRNLQMCQIYCRFLQFLHCQESDSASKIKYQSIGTFSLSFQLSVEPRWKTQLVFEKYWIWKQKSKRISSPSVLFSVSRLKHTRKTSQLPLSILPMSRECWLKLFHEKSMSSLRRKVYLNAEVRQNWEQFRIFQSYRIEKNWKNLTFFIWVVFCNWWTIDQTVNTKNHSCN